TSATTIRKIATSGKSSPILAPPDAVNRPPSEDQKIQKIVGVGVGGASADFWRDADQGGANPTTIKKILLRGHDPATILQSLDNMLADAQAAGHDLEQA